MMTYFQAGGFSMWMILVVAVAAIAVAVAKKGPSRARALWIGSYGCVVTGVFGLAFGMNAVSAHIGRFADKGAAVAQGLGELANNGTFAAILATLLGVAAILVSRANKEEAAA